MKEEEIEFKKAKKWNWFTFIYSLAKGDITKFDEITKMNYIFALTFKAFEIENKKIVQYYNGK